MEFYPLTFQPIYKEKIWGGEGLGRIFQRALPGEKIGESWELAAHFRGTSIVKNGLFRGEQITSLVERYPAEILGRASHREERNKFPLLVKFIDAHDKLSVQVHPDDQSARKYTREAGKTELWYILDARKGAEIVYGLKPGTDQDILASSIRNGKLAEHLNRIKVKKGDFFFIPPGRVHALDGGIILAEIQQNSDTTYRLYDYDRPGSDGKPRPLHIQKALEVINFEDHLEISSHQVIENENCRRSFLSTCPYFTVEKVELSKTQKLHPGGCSFYILLILSGRGNLHYRDSSYPLLPGKTILLPAALEEVLLEGRVEYLKTYLPSKTPGGAER